MMIRDFFAISVTFTEIERTFNQTKNICHYRRFHFFVDTIFNLMMIKHANVDELKTKYESSKLFSKKKKFDFQQKKKQKF